MSSRTRSPQMLTSVDVKKSIIEDTEEKELAAFPLMAQALTYIRAIGSESSSSPPATSSISPTLAMKQRSVKPHSHVSDLQSNINSGDDERSTSNARSSPSPAPSEIPLKKRKLEVGIPNLARPMSLSRASETINIGSRMQDKPDITSLDALAIAASSSTNKKQGRPPQSQRSRIMTANSEDSSLESETSAAAGARCLPPPNIFPRGATHATRSRESLLPSLSEQNEFIIGRLPNRSLSPSLIADYNSARKSVEQQRQQQKIILQHNEKQKEAQKHRERSFTSKVVIPEVPSTLTSTLKIPEVPWGFVPRELRSERISLPISDHLKLGIDPRANAVGPSLTKLSTHSMLGIPNRLSLESYPLGQFPHQIQGLSQHLQGVPPLFPKSPQLLSLQLQSSQNFLINSNRNSSSAYSQHLRQQQLQASEVASSASGASDDHSEITLQRHNGFASRDSSKRG